MDWKKKKKKNWSVYDTTNEMIRTTDYTLLIGYNPQLP